jgi:hypothetical protein
MERFLERHKDRVIGVLSGFDRVLFRGTLRTISYLRGLERFLSNQSVLNKQFGAFVERLSTQLKEHAQEVARKAGRPYQYLPSSKASKEAVARQIMLRDGVREGLICVLACVEPCQSYALRKDRASKHLLIVPAQRKCLHLYFYFVDREFGLMHVRLQSWLPFPLQVCLNGRDYLARQMDRAGMGYEQRDNCFVRIDDLPRAQALLDRLVTRKWQNFLNRLARQLNPLPKQLSLDGYYWTIRQGEFATDVIFRDAASLAAVYPALVDHAIKQFHSPDVLRFLGRRSDRRFQGEIVSDMQRRTEGVRVKHRVDDNSIKMYDKQGSVLRIETTINDPRRFRVRREATRHGQRVLAWFPLRKGLADLTRRVEISRAANERYLEALAVVQLPGPAKAVLDPVQKRQVQHGRPYRALRPLNQDESRLFAAILQGEHLLQGFRNADVRRALFPVEEADLARRRKAAGRTSRLLRLLRAHKLIRKVAHTQYYRITPQGHRVMTTAQRLRDVELAAIAA